ncbi:MAG TPA: prepilin-type N-terminal cleavage/methylation domain-containing protein [Gemmatimonadaceae bacterium]|jgi:type IV pilus assembly protein PilA
MKKNVRRGFTLPEILVTVTVVAVLAAVVVPAVTQFTTKGDAPATSSDISQVRNAISSYVSDTRHYPTDFSDLVSNTASGIANWKGPYFAGALSGTSGVSATFISNGAGATLGPAISQANGYLTTTVSLSSDATCQDIWNLDKTVDGTNTDITTSAANSASGSLTWSGACADGVATGSSSATGASITLQLMAIGQ